MTDRFRDRLSEFRDGELDASEEAIVRRHLEECDECSSVLAELTEVADRAAGLADRVPEDDLWAGIEARIAGGASNVAPLSSRRGTGFRRMVSLTVPQLAAAAVALTTLSTAGAWFALGGSDARLPDTGPAVSSTGGTSLAATNGDADSEALPQGERYADVIAELETTLFDPENRLPPDTEASLRRALLKIDRAIEDAERALQALPGDDYLEDHMEATMRRKADFLRRAVRLSQS